MKKYTVKSTNSIIDNKCTEFLRPITCKILLPLVSPDDRLQLNLIFLMIIKRQIYSSDCCN